MRFLTLTSAENMKRDLPSSFRALKERIKRLTPARLIRMGYIDEKDVRRFYPNKPLSEPLRFEYFKVQTLEGVSGVLHILFFGDYIPHEWLKDSWREITGSAYIVDIRACKSDVKSPKRLARYCVSQYVSGQRLFYRFSWSWGWVAKGFVKVWRFLLEHVKYDVKRAIRYWNLILSGRAVRLGCYVFKPPPELEISVIGQVCLYDCEQGQSKPVPESSVGNR
ncbi:MAG: hypothetical protein H0Z24_10395 [Thermosipho sp. (in: Bacteria)]|nr:hypothetical protein [Thermosipho sp. (in: thermotogales)]